MADPISTASGLVALVVFAFQSSKLLHQAVSSFQNSKRTVRELKEELEDLEGVLQSLLDTVSKTDADLTTLKLPVLRCGKACKDFEAVIAKCTAHSGGPRTSFRDWAKLKYMGDDIVGFKTVIAGYKSTISIALCDANLRTSTVTAAVFKEYKQMITNTTSDLEEHLQNIDNKLQSFSLQGARTSDEGTAEQQQMQEERNSIQQCLGICATVSRHIDQLQPTVYQNISTTTAASRGFIRPIGGLTPARIVTVDAFQACQEKLINTTTQLEKHLQIINNRLEGTSSQPLEAAGAQLAEKETIEEQIDGIRQCLAICADASRGAEKNRTNIFEDITMADDGHQVLVSTIGDLIAARRITAGARSMQVFGQMADDTVQQLSRDRGGANLERATEPQAETGTQFEDRYGAGVRLSPQNPRNAGTGDT